MKIVIAFLLLVVFINYPVQQLNAQNVGVNTTTPEAALDVNGDIIIRTAELTADDGINLALDVNTVRFSYYRITGPTADFTIAGIIAGIDGRLVTLFNRSGFTMQLNNEDATATPEDMIVTGTGTDILIPNKGIVNLQYDGIEQKWIVKSSSKGGAGGTGPWDLNGIDIFNNNAGNVGIGTITPLEKLTVETLNNANGISHRGEGGNILSTRMGGSSAGIGTFSPLNMRIFANGISRILVAEATGNVGIGTDNPGAPLSFPNSFGNKISFWRNSPNSDYGIGINAGVMQLYTAGTDKIAFGWGNANAFNEKIAIHTGTGMLAYPNVFGNKISFWNTGPNNDYGIGLNAGVMQFYTAGSDKMAWGWGNANAFNETMTFYTGSGQLGIGTTNLGSYRLSVNGNIRSKEIVVENIGWPDYVFDNKYKRLPIDQLEKFILQNKHLPNIPSAKEVEEKGLHLGDIIFNLYASEKKHIPHHTVFLPGRGICPDSAGC
jgi:hypothetical protein